MTIKELYEKLTSLPLFRGMGGDELAMVADRVHLRFARIDAGETFIREDEPCQHLAFLVRGRMTKTECFDNGNYSIRSAVDGPMVIEPERLYGLHTRYRCRYDAATTSEVLLITKDDVRYTMLHIPVWRINFLNEISLACTKEQERNAFRPLDSLDEQIMDFVRRHNAKVPLTVHIRMVDLANYLNTSRRLIGLALHRLEQQGLLTMKANEISIRRLKIED